MYGAILGDIIGEPFEFDRGNKSKDFPLFSMNPRFTDDSVMTVAICDGILRAGIYADEKTMKTAMIKSMHKWGRKYPWAGYGVKFFMWLAEERTEPYNSWGNGSAMRVSSAGWLFESLERTREVGRWSAEVTHNHPEGIKGAEATAMAEAFYGLPPEMKEKCLEFTEEDMHLVMKTFDVERIEKKK